MAFVSTPKMRAYAAGIVAKVPSIFWGMPGEGKTATIEAYGERWGMYVATVVGSVREPSDYLGLPMEVDGRVIYSPPAWALDCNDAVNQGYTGAIIFLDELTTSSPATQKANLRLAQERHAGDLRLADHVAIVAAANPPEVAADGYDLPAPVANRFMHLEWDFDTEAWMEGMVTGFADQTVYGLDQMLGSLTEDQRASSRARANGLVTAFLKHKPEVLRPGVPEDETKAGLAWPSPRSWHNVARVLGELDPDDEGAAFLVVKGLVGEGATVEFFAWLATADLWNPADVIANPSIVKWDKERPDRLFAVTNGVAALTLMRIKSADGPQAAKQAAEHWERGMAALTACANGARADVALPAVRQLFSAKPKDAEITRRMQEAFADLFQRSGKWESAA